MTSNNKEIQVRNYFLSGICFIAGSVAALGTQTTITGRISDAMCGADHTMMQHGSKKLDARQCSEACVKAGQKYVLVSKGHVYQITNQSFADLATYAGAPVKATGDVSGDGKSITIANLAPGK